MKDMKIKAATSHISKRSGFLYVCVDANDENMVGTSNGECTQPTRGCFFKKRCITLKTKDMKKLIIYFREDKKAYQVVQPSRTFNGDYEALARAIAGEHPVTRKPLYYKYMVI